MRTGEFVNDLVQQNVPHVIGLEPATARSMEYINIASTLTDEHRQ
jgi:hypothetical protein